MVNSLKIYKFFLIKEKYLLELKQKQGCCESRISPDNNINIITKNRKQDLHSISMKFNNTPKFIEDDINNNNNKENNNTHTNLNTNTNINTKHDSEYKIKKVKYFQLNKSEIPITREVRVPSLEIPYEIIRTRKRLGLTVIEANFLSEGTVLHINPGGLEGSERMAKDGIVTFGIKNVIFKILYLFVKYQTNYK